MKVKIGIIGCGAIVQRAYLPGFSEPDSPLAKRAMQGHFHNGCADVQVVALADINESLTAKLAEEYGVSKVYTDWQKIISDPKIDAVCVATPNYLHAEMVIAALKAGKHVLVEKPMAVSWHDVKEMVRIAKASKLALLVNHSFRYNPIYEKAREIILSGLLGEIYSIRGRFSYAGPEHWTGSATTWFLDKEMAGGGALFDAGIHAVDLIRFLVDKPVIQVGSLLGTLEKKIQAEDNSVTIMKFDDGSLGTLEASWTTRPGEIVTTVYGSEGNMLVDMGEGSASLSGQQAPPLSVLFAPPQTTYMNMKMPPGQLRIPVFIPDIDESSKVGGPYRHFVECILTDKEPISSGQDAMSSMEILFASAQSNQSQKIITLPLKN
jgi:UDP-N-acetylglucosamine 3-dehydrogenase